MPPWTLCFNRRPQTNPQKNKTGEPERTGNKTHKKTKQQKQQKQKQQNTQKHKGRAAVACSASYGLQALAVVFR
jgi:hypothetical protein